MRRCVFAVSIAVVIASCSGVEHQYLPLPEIGSPRTLIVVADEPDPRGLRLVATDPADPNGKLELPISEGATLHLLAYHQSLEELGLSAGPIREPSRSRLHCERLAPDLTFVASGAPDALEWTPGELPQSIRERLIEAPEQTCGACAELAGEEMTLPGTGWPMFAVSSSDGVLVGLDSGALLRITDDLRIAELCSLPSPVRSGAFRESDQSLVIGSSDGRIFRTLALSGPLCSVEQLGAVEGSATRIAVSETGPLVAYVLSDRAGDAVLSRVDTSSTAKLHQYALDPNLISAADRGARGGVTWLGPEHVLFVAGDDAIYRLRDAAITVERLDTAAGIHRIQSSAATPFGPIVGVEPLGIATTDDDGRWRIIDSEPSWGPIAALLSYEGGALLIGQRGALELADLENGSYCPRHTAELAGGEPQSMARLGASDAIVADRPPSEGSLPEIRRVSRR